MNYKNEHGFLKQTEIKEYFVLLSYEGGDLNDPVGKSPYYISDLSNDEMKDIRNFIEKAMKENKTIVIRKLNIYDWWNKKSGEENHISWKGVI